ncbi:MAG: DUF6089 family protein [Bacteroidales bacterium]
MTGLISLQGFSQLEVGLFAGGSYYIGDLNPTVPFLMTRPAYGAVARYTLSSRWVARVNAFQGKVEGDDNVSNFLPERNLSFNNKVTELAGTMEFHFLPYFNGSLKQYFTPYIFAGAGFFYHKPQSGETDLADFGTEGQNNTEFLPDGVERPGYSKFVPSIPFGIGVKYSFTQFISASLEWGMRKTFTDYIDDVSTTYYLPSNLDPSHPDYNAQSYSDPGRNHEPMMQRGNSATNDWLSFFGLSITYYIDLRNKNKCPDFQERY